MTTPINQTIIPRRQTITDHITNAIKLVAHPNSNSLFQNSFSNPLNISRNMLLSFLAKIVSNTVSIYLPKGSQPDSWTY